VPFLPDFHLRLPLVRRTKGAQECSVTATGGLIVAKLIAIATDLAHDKTPNYTITRRPAH
jgi:hypothetical protein